VHVRCLSLSVGTRPWQNRASEGFAGVADASGLSDMEEGEKRRRTA